MFVHQPWSPTTRFVPGGERPWHQDDGLKGRGIPVLHIGVRQRIAQRRGMESWSLSRCGGSGGGRRRGGCRAGREFREVLLERGVQLVAGLLGVPTVSGLSAMELDRGKGASRARGPGAGDGA